MAVEMLCFPCLVHMACGEEGVEVHGAQGHADGHDFAPDILATVLAFGAAVAEALDVGAQEVKFSAWYHPVDW